MHNLSITTKITLWYALMLTVITACFVSMIIYTGDRNTVSIMKTELLDEVEAVPPEIEMHDGNLELDTGFKLYDDGVYISVYDENNYLIEGKIPVAAYDQPVFKDGEYTTIVDDEGVKWFIYDRQFTAHGEKVWVRGIMKEMASKNALYSMKKLALLGLPALLLLGILGGYFITRRSFAPVRDMIDVVAGIEEDGDFSRRINLEKDEIESSDEMKKLSVRFNSMFDKVEHTVNKEKQFTSDVSHELRTPLASIISQSDYALEDVEYREEALKKINKEARRMAELVNRLLLLSRSDSGRLEIEKVKLSLSDLCEMVAEQQQIQAEEKGFELYEDIEPNIEVVGDDASIIRILLNLTDNAIKYGKNEETGKTIIRIGLKSEGNKAICSVSDEGPGISEEHIDKLWDRFYRVDKSRRDGSSGLGLSMVRTLAHANDAHVYVKSEEGKGSTFYIEFMKEESK